MVGVEGMAELGACDTTSVLGVRRYVLLETVAVHACHDTRFVSIFVDVYVVNVYLAGITIAFRSHAFTLRVLNACVIATANSDGVDAQRSTINITK